MAERAGVSRGAHLHHFQTRSALVAAAVEQLRAAAPSELWPPPTRCPPGRERVAAGLDLLWRSYASPLYQGALDLWTDARTDAELRGHLVDVERELDRQTLELARRLFPEAAERPDFERLIELAARDGPRARGARHAAPRRRAQPASSGRSAARGWPSCSSG